MLSPRENELLGQLFGGNKENEIFTGPPPLRPNSPDLCQVFWPPDWPSLVPSALASGQILATQSVDQTSSVGLAPALVRNAESWAPPQTRWIEICSLTSYPEGAFAKQSVRSSGRTSHGLDLGCFSFLLSFLRLSSPTLS